MNLSELTKALSTLNRDALVKAITLDSWRFWGAEISIEEMLKSGNQYPFLLRAYGHKLAALAWQCSDPEGKWRVTSYDIDVLLRKYLDVDDIFTGSETEPERIIQAIKEHGNITSYSSLPAYLTEDLGKRFRVQSFMARQLNSQFQMCCLKGAQVERNYLIFKRFVERIAHDDRQKIESYLNHTPVSLLRAGYALLSLTRDRDENLGPGIVGFKEGKREAFSLEELDITYDDIKHCAHRLSWGVQELKEQVAATVNLEDINAKHFTSPFSLKPFIDWEIAGWDKSFICPSPWLILVKLSSIFTDFYADIFSIEKAKALYSVWGRIAEEVFREVIQEVADLDELIDIDEIEEGANKSRFADLILYQNGAVLIIEFKRSMASIKDKDEFGPENLAKILFRQLSALEQCHASYGKLEQYLEGKEIRQVAYVVATSQYQIYDFAVASTLDSDSDYFSDMDYPGFDIMDMDKIESILNKYSVAKAVELINKRTNLRRQKKFEDLSNDFYSSSSSENIQIYQDAKGEIFPPRPTALP